MIGKWARLALLCLVCLAMPGSSVHVLAVTSSENGPAIASGVLSRLWQADFRDGWSNVVMLDDVLVLTHGEHVEGRDAATGRTLWAFSTSDIDGYTAPEDRLETVGDLIVAVAPHRDPRGDSLLVFNGRTGAILWDLATGIYGTEMPPPYFSFLGVGRSRAVIHIPDLRVLRGLDIVDGQRRWDSPLPSGCHSQSGDADEWVTAILMTCGGRAHLRVLETSTGMVLWERKAFPLSNPLVTVAGGAVSLASDHAFVVYDIDGRRLYEHIAERTCECWLAATRTGLLILRSEPDLDDFVAEAVDRRNGRVIPMDGERDTFLNAWVIDGRIYGLRRLGDMLQGVVIVAIDPATGGQRPIAALPRYAAVADMNRHTLLIDPGIDADRTSLAAYTITAPRAVGPGTASQAGVVPGNWPDACALVPPAALKAEFPRARYTAVPRPAPPELNVRTPVGCDLIPQDAKYPILTLSVLWMGATADEAENIFRTVMRDFRVSVEEAVTLRSGARLYVDEVDATLIQAGRTVVRLDGTRSRDIAERLAHQVTHTLRATT